MRGEKSAGFWMINRNRLMGAIVDPDNPYNLPVYVLTGGENPLCGVGFVQTFILILSD